MIVFACALLACTQDPCQALRHYEAGDFAAAAEAFRAATTARPDAADLWYDLALAEWRAGKLPAAEDAAERYASTPGGGRVDLHRGLLGNIRYSEAAALGQQAEAPPQPPPAAGAAAPAPPGDPVALLEQAIGKAKAARDEFVRAAAAPTAGGEVARNTERALKLLADLEKKLEEAKKRRDEQQKQDQKNDQKDKNDKNDKNDKDKNDKSDKDQQDKKDQKDQKDQQPKDGEARPEPKQPDPKEQKDQQQKDQQQQQQDPQAKDGEARPEPKPEDGKDGKEPKPAPQPRSDAPGEQLQATELTPEQKARLLEELQKLDGELRKIRAAARVGKKPVERDW